VRFHDGELADAAGGEYERIPAFRSPRLFVTRALETVRGIGLFGLRDRRSGRCLACTSRMRRNRGAQRHPLRFCRRSGPATTMRKPPKSFLSHGVDDSAVGGATSLHLIVSENELSARFLGESMMSVTQILTASKPKC
jgi:hypothetical protein